MPDETDKPRSPRKLVLVTVLLTLGVVAGAGALVLRTDWAEDRITTAYRPRGYDWPQYNTLDLRHQVLADRDGAMGRDDLVTAAYLNGVLSQEALVRADAVQRAWLGHRHPQTRLYAQHSAAPEWNYRNTAADLFGFLIHAGLRLNPESLPSLQETLDAEAKLAPPGELCQPVQAATGAKVNEDREELMFASTEYVKDGLLGVYERWGNDQPSAGRLFDVLDAVLKHSAVPSNFGGLPGKGSEENGNIVQACTRLYFATGDERYADLAARIADAAVQQMLPACNGLPVKQFDYVKNKSSDSRVRIRDHGNEIIPGLTEVYALAVTRSSDPAWKARADRWAEPIALMLEKLLRHGRGADGLFVSTIDAFTLKHTDARPNDNWGYITNAMLLFPQAARKHGLIAPDRLVKLEAGVDAIADAVSKQYGIQWERAMFDGYCDTLESALYTAHHRPQTAAVLLPWVDHQMELLLETQKGDGFIDKGYLDGNYIRTALLYADLRSGGWTIQPWKPTVRVGFARQNNMAVVVVTANSDYQGKLLPDRPRHREIMKLPWDWPRLNSWPEWFTTEEANRVVDAKGLPATPTLDQLRNGLPLNLKAGDRVELRLGIKPR